VLGVVFCHLLLVTGLVERDIPGIGASLSVLVERVVREGCPSRVLY
jgi:hypothetical protein